MRGFLADYSVDLEVYDYWVWRYYPEWIDWYRNQQSEAGGDAPAEAAVQQSTAGDAAAAAGDAANAGRDAATAVGDAAFTVGDGVILVGML